MSRLVAENVSISFGGVVAVDDVSLSANAGEILSIIGPNGAGKTTLFNIISGVYVPKTGRVRLMGSDVTGMGPHHLAQRGMSRTFQNLQIFFRLSVIENVMVGRQRWERTSVFSDLLGLPSVQRQNEISFRAARDLLSRVGLAAQMDRPAGGLPYGLLKRLEIARALATEPDVLLLDEPAAGCNAVETEEIDALIQEIARNGVAVVLVEHDMKLVMKISTRVMVLNQGRLLAEGPPAEVRNNTDVIAAYLGRRAAEEDAHVAG